MSNGGGVNRAFEQLSPCGLMDDPPDRYRLRPAWCVSVAVEDWQPVTKLAAGKGLRWAGLWADRHEEYFSLHAALELGGDYLVLKTSVPRDKARLGSQGEYFPAAVRMERHVHDLFGIEFAGQPDNRRWTRHQAWPEDRYPLRDDFPRSGHSPGRAPADSAYPFVPVAGTGVTQIPVGPVHAGIIEPGHFRFHAVGETVLSLEERLGYVHKGIEKIAAGRDAAGLARLAGRVSGDATVAHAWAACMAMEHAAGVCPPPRALALRAILAERERIANHLGDIGAVCNDVGFSFVHMQCARLRERWQRRSRELFGHRLLMDCVIPGGVARDLDAAAVQRLRVDHDELRRETRPLFEIVSDHPALEDRLVGTGCLAAADARELGCTGYVGKASGVDFDVRRDCPYAPYEGMRVDVPVVREGDVAARVQVRMAEVCISLDLMDRLLDELVDGEVAVAWPEIVAGSAGLGIVEGWRGEIITYVRFAGDGRIARFFPRDPSWFTWPALERLIDGNIVPDFPVCNKSVNASYSGHDL